ncbi:hypothetical protein DFH11DRAFT_1865014 [Phellopilus nigrolimitatus]|nr:hypothetical protein DFH11DRAFT_1865014 [Phellopilus nigrolimitatus]
MAPIALLSDSNDHIEDSEDILSASLGILYGYTTITHAEAGAKFTYTYPGHTEAETAIGKADGDRYELSGEVSPITLTLYTPDTHARNWALHASSVWASAIFLADHVGELGLAEMLRGRVGDKECATSESGRCSALEVLELGASAGLPGLLVAKCLERIAHRDRKLAWRVTLSDYPDDLLIDTLRANVQRNFKLDSAAETDIESGAREHVHVVPYAWGDDVSSVLSSLEPSSSETNGYDLILAADTLWDPASHLVFLHTISILLRRTPSARVHLVAGLHTGRYTICAFLNKVTAFRNECVRAGGPGLEVGGIEEWDVGGGGKRRPWAEERGNEDEGMRRRWVVWINLRWSDLQRSNRLY